MTPSLRTWSCCAAMLLIGAACMMRAVDARAGAPISFDIAIAQASPSQGRAVASAQCGICHSFADHGPSLIGPDLYGVVGRPVAALPGYSYSTALSAKKGIWTAARLNAWLAAPADWAPGTKMGYAGLRDPALRIDVIAYLQTLGPKILPFK